jgi:hypothetical protein
MNDNTNSPIVFNNKVSKCIVSHGECTGQYISADGRYVLICSCTICGHSGDPKDKEIDQ